MPGVWCSTAEPQPLNGQFFADLPLQGGVADGNRDLADVALEEVLAESLHPLVSEDE